MTPTDGALSIHDVRLGAMLGWRDYARRGEDPEFARRTAPFDGRLSLAIDDAWAELGFPIGSLPVGDMALRIEGIGFATVAHPGECRDWLREHPHPTDAAIHAAVSEARDMGERTGVTCGFVGTEDGAVRAMFLIARGAAMDIDRRPDANVKLGYVVEPRLLADAAEADPRLRTLVAAVLRRQVVHDLLAVFGRIGSADTGVRIEVACAGDAPMPDRFDAALRAGIDEFLYRRMVGRFHCPRVQCRRAVASSRNSVAPAVG